ncbi:MAG: glycine cleavage system protein R [Alphaproteobacteria bacterium]
MPKIVLTMMADDRPGLVRAVSDCVVSHGGNWLESRMAQLAGKFAGVILIEVSDSSHADLLAALQALASDDIALTVQAGDDVDPGDAQAVVLKVDGADHPGIVHEVTDLLVRRNINIREMETGTHAAAMTGQPIFAAEIHALLPADTTQADLGEALAALAADLQVDIDLEAG